MYVAVTRAWFRMFTHEERRRHPLRPHLFDSDFVRSVTNSRVDLSLVASVCARLACSHRLYELGAEMLPLARSVREALDPLAAWWCAFDGSDGLGLHYVELGCGTLEFLSVAHQTDRPRADSSL
jgi:hypothetical protein